MDIKRKADKIFSAEEQRKILRRGRRRFQTSNLKYEMRNAVFYKSAVRAKKSRRATTPDGLSNTMDVAFCVEALEEALGKFGTPEIFNTDQGAQFTSEAFTGMLEAHGVAISMDGRGRAFDNIFTERFWRNIKYEWLYLHSFDSIRELRAGLGKYIAFYNFRRTLVSHKNQIMQNKTH